MGLGEGEMMMGLDLKLCTMKSVNGFLKEAAVEGGDGKATKMEEFVKLLEEEKTKIEVFKRELPLCMHLIGDVIEGLKREVEKCRVETKKRKLEEEEETDRRDKMSWMSSAQLWSDNCSNNNANNTNNVSEKKMSQEEKRKSASVEINVNGAGAFTPFKGVTAPPPPPVAAKKEEAAIAAVGLPDLSLLSPAMRSPPPTIAVAGDGGRARVVGRGPVAASAAAAAAGPLLSLQPQPPPQGTPSAAAAAAAAAARKARRCWSPELHRRFVMALEHLGGAQVATPKQIRELMKVDGLTNDEVKSHLQKYRLHTRRMPNTAPDPNPQVVVMGGLWMHQQQQQQQQQRQQRQQQQEQDTASQQSTSQSGSPQGPLQFNSHGRALSMTTTTNGDSCEDEDARSESYSWE